MRLRGHAGAEEKRGNPRTEQKAKEEGEKGEKHKENHGEKVDATEQKDSTDEGNKKPAIPEGMTGFKCRRIN
jgi:hypothetical protein